MALVLYSVGAHDDVSVLWGKFAGGMSESKRGIVQTIEAHTRDEYGAVSVGALFEVLRETIEADIVRLGGKPGWVSALESIAQLSFKRIPSSVPLSAALVSSVAVDGRAAERRPLAQVTPSTTNSGGLKFKHPHGEKLGAYLKRTNQLSLLRLPKADILALCKETTDFHGRLAYKDSAAVASYVFKFVCITFQDPGGCKILFKQLAEELKLIGIPWPNKGAWPDVLQRRFQVGRSSKAVSCIPAPQPALCSCPDPHPDRRSCMRAQSTCKSQFISSADEGAAVQALRDAGLHLPTFNSALQPLLAAPTAISSIAAARLGVETFLDGNTDELLSAGAAPLPASVAPTNAPTAAAQPAAESAEVPPPLLPSLRHSTHAQKDDELHALLEDTDRRVATLHTQLTSAAPAPLFHTACEAAPAPPAKPAAKPAAKKPAAKKSSDDSSDDESDDDDDSSDSEDEPEYEALAILDKRTYRRRIQYLVQWANGPNGESYQPTWEPKENVGLQLIDAYEAPQVAEPPTPMAKPNAKKRKHASSDVNPAVNPAVNLATTRPKRQCAPIPPAAGPAAPPAAPPVAPPAAPPAPPPRAAMTLNKQGVDPSVRYGTITGLPENSWYDELQVKASMVDDYGTGVFVKNDEEVYVIGEARCESSSKAFYRVATVDGCAGFILSHFVELHA